MLRLLSALKTPKIFCPTAILRFALDILQKNRFFRLFCWLQLMFSIFWSESQFFSVYRGTLKILPFSENCVFDCINKLCRHPVDPILWGFCRTQLKCLGWQTNKQNIYIDRYRYTHSMTESVFVLQQHQKKKKKISSKKSVWGKERWCIVCKRCCDKHIPSYDSPHDPLLAQSQHFWWNPSGFFLFFLQARKNQHKHKSSIVDTCLIKWWNHLLFRSTIDPVPV